MHGASRSSDASASRHRAGAPSTSRCGALGWLRILGESVGPSGQVVGTDIDKRPLLAGARSSLAGERISNVELVVDDLFDSRLEQRSFDLVHARFQIAPLGRSPEQVASHGS